MINGKTYYQILGVLDGAEDIVIRAAYKVLAQKYHPDKWKGDAGEATRKMSDINIAYETLSDARKRSSYDEQLGKNDFQTENKRFEDEEQFETAGEDTDAWTLAVEFYPDLKIEFQNLSKINRSLANTYKIYLIKHQLFNKYAQVSKDMTEKYLEKYFGSHPDVRQLAKDLLLRRQYKVARFLNDVVTKMGVSVGYSQIYELLMRKFPMEMSGRASDPDRRTPFWQRFDSDNFSADDAMEALNRLGFKTEVEYHFFGTVYRVEEKDGRVNAMRYDDLVVYIRTEILPLAKKNGWF